MRRRAISGLALVLSFAAASDGALAQTLAQSATGKASARRGPPKLTINQPLKAPPANFAAPIPTGSKFVMGYEAKYATSRPSTVLRLRDSGEMKGLTQFYTSGFTSQGWKVTSSSPKGKVTYSQLVATKPDLSCLVQLMPASGGKEKGTDIMITLTHK